MSPAFYRNVNTMAELHYALRMYKAYNIRRLSIAKPVLRDSVP